MTDKPSVDLLSKCLESSQDSSDSFEDFSVMVRQSYKIIEPWCHARSDDAVVNTLVTQIASQGYEYSTAVRLSLEVAQMGCSFAGEALDLCDYICSCQSVQLPLGQMKQYVAEMVGIAEKTQECATAMEKQFRQVRVGLFEINKNVLVHAQRFETGVIIELPSPIPDEIAMDSGQHNEPTHATQKTTLEEGFSQIQRVLSDLESIATYVTNFANWWLTMATDLRSLHSSLTRMTLSPNGVLRRELVKRKWQNVKQRYDVYCKQISAIQDYYPTGVSSPPCILRSPEPCRHVLHASWTDLAEGLDSAPPPLPLPSLPQSRNIHNYPRSHSPFLRGLKTSYISKPGAITQGLGAVGGMAASLIAPVHEPKPCILEEPTFLRRKMDKLQAWIGGDHL